MFCNSRHRDGIIEWVYQLQTTPPPAGYTGSHIGGFRGGPFAYDFILTKSWSHANKMVISWLKKTIFAEKMMILYCKRYFGDTDPSVPPGAIFH